MDNSNSGSRQIGYLFVENILYIENQKKFVLKIELKTKFEGKNDGSCLQSYHLEGRGRKEDHPSLYNEFKASPGYMTPFLKNK